MVVPLPEEAIAVNKIRPTIAKAGKTSTAGGSTAALVAASASKGELDLDRSLHPPNLTSALLLVNRAGRCFSSAGRLGRINESKDATGTPDRGQQGCQPLQKCTVFSSRAWSGLANQLTWPFSFTRSLALQDVLQRGWLLLGRLVQDGARRGGAADKPGDPEGSPRLEQRPDQTLPVQAQGWAFLTILSRASSTDIFAARLLALQNVFASTGCTRPAGT